MFRFNAFSSEGVLHCSYIQYIVVAYVCIALWKHIGQVIWYQLLRKVTSKQIQICIHVANENKSKIRNPNLQHVVPFDHRDNEIKISRTLGKRKLFDIASVSISYRGKWTVYSTCSTLTFDHVIWKSIETIYLLDFQANGQKILSGQHLLKDQQLDLNITRGHLHAIFIHCTKFRIFPAKG